MNILDERYEELIIQGLKQMHYDPDKGIDRIRQEIDSYYMAGPNTVVFVMVDGIKNVYNSSKGGISRLYNDKYDKFELSEEQWMFSFAKRLREKMSETRITQKELARRANISERMISQYLNCKSIPNGYNVEKIAASLGCDVGEIIQFDWRRTEKHGK